MKKFFTLALALIGLSTVAKAATVNDLELLKNAYVLVIDEYSNNGTAAIAPGLIGDNHFLVMKSMPAATNKGSVDLSTVSEFVTEEIVNKYGEYGTHLNSARLKNADIKMAMKVSAGTKLIFFLQGNNKVGKEARIPKLSKNEDLSNALNPAPDADHPATVAGFRFDFTVPNDWGTNDILYVGSYNGDMFLSYIIVEPVEAPGTPTVKVGDQTFDGGLWFREVTAKANPATEEGSEEQIPTILTYTTDGTTPTAASPVYTEPIKCYQNMTVKFQAFLDFGDGKADDDLICDGADLDAPVSFSFDAPSIEANGGSFTINSPYAAQNGANFYALNGGEAVAGDGTTLTESATVTAYTEIANGEYGTFTSNSSTKDVYVLNPIKEKKTIQVIAGDVILDEETTATSTTGEVWKIENGEISTDKMDFFVKNLTLKAIKDEQYQVPEGNERYIQMSNTNITFMVAAGDSVTVKVVCSKNSCKNIDAEDAEDGSMVNDRKCVVNVSGTNHMHMDAEGNEASDLKLTEDANIIEFGLKASEENAFFTFQKYSGTGNILISSIEITPAEASAITTVNAAVNTNTARFNVAGQKVAEGYKGLVIKNGQKMIQK